MSYAVTALLAGLLLALGLSKALAVPVMRERAAHVGVPVRGYRLIGLAELAAAVGLVAGHWWPLLGTAAALGVVLLMAGAVLAHLRVGDALPQWLPAVATAALAGGYLWAIA